MPASQGPLGGAQSNRKNAQQHHREAAHRDKSTAATAGNVAGVLVLVCGGVTPAPTFSLADSGAATPVTPAPEAAAGGAAPEGGKKLTAKELRMLEREKAAAAKAAASATKNADVFGEMPMIQSQTISGKVWTKIPELDVSKADTTVLVRGRVHATRETSKVLFMTLRQSISTVQAIVLKSDNADLFKFAGSLPKETVVEVTAKVTKVEKRVESATQGDVELTISKLFVVSKASPVLPFQLEDASRPDAVIEARDKEVAEAEAAGKTGADVPARFPNVNADTRLDYRWIDLRTPANQAIMRLSSAVCTLFREYLLSKDFVEIQTPKILGGASEGGSAVFTLQYFGEPACLAQSPQLYKQMAAACSDLERVFEIGPVFRAENSNTHRHLCEFHGLDIEMVINEHYYEVLDTFSELFTFIFDGLNKRYRKEIEAVRAQHPFEDLVYHNPSLRITYEEGLSLLREAGVSIAFGDDLSTAQERQLGAIVKERYGTDFFMMDQYPSSLRPFYTMPSAENPLVSNSYDFFIRGEEILSGAQRVHDPELLARRAEACGIPVRTIQSYVDSFKHGALPHGGGGIGLERVVMLFLGLGNIRKASMFPRDPKRLFP